MLYTDNQIRNERLNESERTNFEEFDSIVGTITGCGQHGCYVTDEETGVEVCFNGNGNIGDRVCLGAEKVKPEADEILWVLETVLEYGSIAA